MIAMIKTSPNCEATLKQGQWREQIDWQLFGSLQREIMHLNVISFIYSSKQIFTESLLYIALGEILRPQPLLSRSSLFKGKDEHKKNQ